MEGRLPTLSRRHTPPRSGIPLPSGAAPRERVAERVATHAEQETASPVFNPERLAAQVCTDRGACFVQGKYLFTLKGVFVGEAPKELWYLPTAEQEENNRKARAKFRAREIAKRVPKPAIPDKVIEASRENAQARAAEEWAE